jgi:predicted transcriptional regulator of viral defense system
MFIQYLDKLRSQGKRFFTFAQILSDLGTSVNSIKGGIFRLKREGKIITPAKGLYVIIPPEYSPYGSIPAEELTVILMKYLKVEYYVSLLSAASFYAASHQKPGRFQIVTNRQIKHPLEFGQIKLEIIYKKHLENLPTKEFTLSTGYLKVASPELIVFDLLNYQARAGGLNHIATVLTELVVAIDSNKLLELANYIKEKAWLQRFGFILEKIDCMEIDKLTNLIEVLKNYLHDKSLSYIPLAPEVKKTGHKYIKQWKIIENTSIESDL